MVIKIIKKKSFNKEKEKNMDHKCNQFILKRDDFYEIPIEFFMNKSDQNVVDDLWKKFWVTGMNN